MIYFKIAVVVIVGYIFTDFIYRYRNITPPHRITKTVLAMGGQLAHGLMAITVVLAAIAMVMFVLSVLGM